MRAQFRPSAPVPHAADAPLLLLLTGDTPLAEALARELAPLPLLHLPRAQEVLPLLREAAGGRGRARSVELLLLDAAEPELETVGLLAALAALAAPGAEAPDALVFGPLSPAQVQGALAAGAVDLVPAPLLPLQLAHAARRALERRQLRAAGALHAAGQEMLAAHPPERVPAAVAAACARALAADDVSLLLPRADGSLRRVSSAPEQLPPGPLAVQHDGVALRVARAGAPRLMQGGASGDPAFTGLPDSARVSSSLLVPLATGERQVGVLAFNRGAAARPFRRRDLARAEQLGTFALLALENARRAQESVSSGRLSAVTQLVGQLGHELNNPAAIVLSNLHFLSEGLESLRAQQPPHAEGAAALAELCEAARDARAGAERIRHLGERLHLLGQGDAAAHDELDLSELMRAALREARLHDDPGLQAALAPDARVRGSPRRLAHVLHHLFVHAAGSPGTVRVSTRREGGRVIAEVEGRGAAAGPDGGSLDLALARDVVQQHRGEVEADLLPDGSVRFVLSLPGLLPA